MELKWLDDFIMLASCGSFSKAAVQRNVTQPALSRRIRALENWVGTPLIDRSAYPTRLTPAGRKFRIVAGLAADDLRRARDELRTEAAADRFLVRFAALHTLALTFFPRWLSSMCSEGAWIRSRLAAENLHDCVELLSSGACDLLLCYSHPNVPVLLDDTRFLSTLLGKEHFVPVVRSDLAARSKLPGTARSPVAYLGYPAETLLGQLTSLILSNAPKANLDLRYENSMAEALKAMVIAGAGLAWLPSSLIVDELEQGRLVTVGDETWRISMEIRLYRRAERASSSVEAVWTQAKANE
jgi:DNA-binding transcriptional LysR family regulator